MENKLDKNFWTTRYVEGTTGWDVGQPTTPLRTYIDGLDTKELKILVPGAGNAYEVEYLWNNGFHNTYVLDISEVPIENFKKRNPDFPLDQILLMDFFNLEETFDLVVEQTFFCALDPQLRQAYANKMAQVIQPGGKLVGVLFGVQFDKEGPPFGGTAEEYVNYFSSQFIIKRMEVCKNSIPPRAGNELWIELVRK